MILWVVLRHVSVDHHCLGGSLLADQEHTKVLLGNEVNQVVGSHVVHHGYQDLSVLRGVVGGVVILCDLGVPMGPFSC